MSEPTSLSEAGEIILSLAMENKDLRGILARALPVLEANEDMEAFARVWATDPFGFLDRQAKVLAEVRRIVKQSPAPVDSGHNSPADSGRG